MKKMKEIKKNTHKVKEQLFEMFNAIGNHIHSKDGYKEIPQLIKMIKSSYNENYEDMSKNPTSIAIKTSAAVITINIINKIYEYLKQHPNYVMVSMSLESKILIFHFEDRETKKPVATKEYIIEDALFDEAKDVIIAGGF
jgi:hypothetical protein